MSVTSLSVTSLSSRRLAAALLVSLVAACGGDGEVKTASSTASATSASPADSGSATASATSSGSASPAGSASAPATGSVTASASASPSDSGSASAAVPAEPIAYCVDQAQQDAGGITLKRDDGVELPGLLIGTGDRGVVLANMGPNDLCDWLTYAPELADAGYSVVVFNYSGTKEHEDVLAAAAALRERGATKVVLMGASVGGANVLQAGAALDPAPAAVVSLSPAASETALAAVKQLDVPTLFVTGAMDAPFVESTKEFHGGTAAKDKTLKVIPDENAHGTALLLMDPIKADIFAFIDKHTK